MKHLFSIFFISFSFQFLSAQTQAQSSNVVFDSRHEIKLEAIKLLAIPVIELNYEYIKDVNQGFGAILLLNLDKEKFKEKFSLTPYFRFYFNTNQEYGAKGFFVKVFTSLYSGRDIELFSSDQKDNYFDIALGFGVGQKLINNSGFVFEYYTNLLQYYYY